jgi:CRISPR/Cas system CMR-associated protein Cmr5 small subunit
MRTKQAYEELKNSTQTPGIAILKKELEKTRILESIDLAHKKHSGYKLSDIVCFGIFKNTLNIPTLTESSEYFCNCPEYPININRTTISRNFKELGKLNIHNSILHKQVKLFIHSFNIKPSKIRIVIDETTIEVSKESTYEKAKWVWDNAQKKIIFGYYVTIIGIAFNDHFLPIYYQIGQPDKLELIPLFEKIRNLTKSNIVLFDGGYASDNFFEALTEKHFIFYSKVPKSWIFNNGLNESVANMRSKLNLNKNNYYQISAFRVKDNKISNSRYMLNFKEGDARCIITNNNKTKSYKAFREFKTRWDIETCNSEIKENFCFEKLPIRNINGIIGYLLTTFIAFNLMNTIKYRFKRKLKLLFNKGFKKIIRIIIKAKGIWSMTKKSLKLFFYPDFKFKWIYKKYNLI